MADVHTMAAITAVRPDSVKELHTFNQVTADIHSPDTIKVFIIIIIIIILYEY
jgi:hypothetical protein